MFSLLADTGRANQLLPAVPAAPAAAVPAVLGDGLLLLGRA
jgi:hypothetical protein